MGIIAFIVWLIVVIIIAVCLLAVVRSVLAWPMFAGWQPYTNTIYALIVLLIVLLLVALFYHGGGVPNLNIFPARR